MSQLFYFRTYSQPKSIFTITADTHEQAYWSLLRKLKQEYSEDSFLALKQDIIKFPLSEQELQESWLIEPPLEVPSRRITLRSK